MRLAFVLILIGSMTIAAGAQEEATVSGNAALAGEAVVPFLENIGQIDASVAYYARVTDGCVFVMADGRILYALDKKATHMGGSPVLSESITAPAALEPAGLERVKTTVSVYKGGDSSDWRSSVPAFQAVDMGEIAPGVRAELRARGANVEKVFIVAPGADPSAIGSAFEDATDIVITDGGEMIVAAASSGSIGFTRPIAYQDGPAGREMVPVRYRAEGRTYGFDLGSYDTSRELIIDPLLTSTRLGGSGDDAGYCGSAIALAPDGSVYVTGFTSSSDFPGVTGEPYGGGDTDVYVAHMSADLSTLHAACYLGGAAADEACAITVTSDGGIVVTGSTTSSTYPTTVGAYDRTYAGGTAGPYNAPGDAFISKLSPDLSTLTASTFYGGSGHEYSRWVAEGAGGSLFITGATSSSGLATSGAFDEVRDPAGIWGGEDAYVARFDGTLATLEAATYVGGSNFDMAEAMVLDAAGNPYITGWTASNNFPLGIEPFDDEFEGGTYDAFVTGLSADLSGLLGSTYLGGTAWDFGYGIDCALDGSIYVTGHMAENGVATTFPTTEGAYVTEYIGTGGPGTGDDGFVSKFDAALTDLEASTLFGGTGWDFGCDVDCAPDGSVYVAGWTRSSDYPTHLTAFQRTPGDDAAGDHDVLVSKFTSDLTDMPRSTLIGGSGDDGGEWMVLSPDGFIYVSGKTGSPDFPTTPGAYAEGDLGGETDAFIALLNDELDAVSFEWGPRTGVGPCDIDFQALAPTTPPTSTWQWDFDNDGVIDATGDSPTWSYAQPGYFDVRVSIPYGTRFANWVERDCVRVFDRSAALSFDGDSARVTAPAAPELNLVDDLTLEAWIRPTGWGTYPFGMWGYGGIVHKEKFALYVIGEHFAQNNHSVCLKMVHTDATTSFSCAPVDAIALDVWQHVAVTYDAATSTTRMWVDGAEVAVTHSVAPSGAIADNATDDLHIGNSFDHKWSFEGEIDEIRIWSEARTSDAIEATVEYPLFGDETGLEAYWRMDDGSGAVLLDETASAHSAGIEGPDWVQGVVLYATSVPEDGDVSVAGMRLGANHPNPFNPLTRIAFDLRRPTDVTLRVYDAAGRLVRTLLSGELGPGSHSVEWDGRDDTGRRLASGVYLYRLSSQEGSEARKMVLLK